MVMHDAHEISEINQPSDQTVPANTLEQLDVLKLQLIIAHQGMIAQELENLQLKHATAMVRQESGKAEMLRFQTFLKQKYQLVDGVDALNYATGEIKRGGSGETRG